MIVMQTALRMETYQIPFHQVVFPSLGNGRLLAARHRVGLFIGLRCASRRSLPRWDSRSAKQRICDRHFGLGPVEVVAVCRTRQHLRDGLPSRLVGLPKLEV